MPLETASLLSLEKPAKAMNPADCPRYRPNMSDEALGLFRARHIKGADERVEIRTSRFGCETLIVVYKQQKVSHENYFCYDDHLDVRMSSNGKMHLTFENMAELYRAVQETREILGNAGGTPT